MTTRRRSLIFVHLGHSYDHLFMLLFPTVVLALEDEFGRSYGELLTLSVWGFIAFGAGTLPAGWLGDRWSRRGMMVVFFLGIGASSVLTGLATSTVGIAVGLAMIGLFASIYHPIGTAMVVGGAAEPGRALGVNGVWGNMGVAAAALIAGALTDWVGWRAAFIVPGVIAVATGLVYAVTLRDGAERSVAAAPAAAPAPSRAAQVRAYNRACRRGALWRGHLQRDHRRHAQYLRRAAGRPGRHDLRRRWAGGDWASSIGRRNTLA